MDDSSRPPFEISRRRVVQLLGTGAAAVAATTAMATPAVAVAPRAAVLEFGDKWTNATGLKKLLIAAGFTVVPLNLSEPATAQGVDLIAFGGFTNNNSKYINYVATQTESLRDFVSTGGTVLDLAQSDQIGAAVSYLPATLSAARTDFDCDTIYPVDTNHPLVSALPLVSGQVFTGRASGIRVSWEAVGEWTSMRVLLSCAAGTSFPPALLEGAHGAGRFLVSSLTIDKCYDRTSGAKIQSASAIQDSVTFFTALKGYVTQVRAGTAPAVDPTPMPTQLPREPAVGPLVGHVDETTARIWARPGVDPVLHPDWKCVVRTPTWEATFNGSISTANDNTLLVDVQGLQPNTDYTFTITPRSAAVFERLSGSFTTAPTAGAAAKVTLGVGSCVDTEPNYVWQKIIDQGCEGFVLLGDTPYIDSPTLGVARTKHRRFLEEPEVAAVVRRMPVWGTWDDHDFGGNDIDGRFAGKNNTRQAFIDYRANASFGHATNGSTPLTERTTGEGVYTSFRRGPIEVFLIDPRWFSQTGPSFANPAKKTCMGQVQWDWLRTKLMASTATFKVLASGMVWYDKIHTEKDDWNTYKHEKDAILNLIRTERIRGCVLLSGDIHVSRAVKNFDSTTSNPLPVGYDLWEYVVSPLHGRTLGARFNVRTTTEPWNPNVLRPQWIPDEADPVKWSKDEPYTFLKLVADSTVSPATLTATWINRDGVEIHSQTRTETELTAPA
ncbi:alkaline phosphatase D family protein [Kitasatospora sp. NPDC001574]